MLDICQHNIPTKTPPINAKKGNRNGKKGDDQKSEDKESNTAGTTGAHVEDTPPSEESTAPSGEPSINTAAATTIAIDVATVIAIVIATAVATAVATPVAVGRGVNLQLF